MVDMNDGTQSTAWYTNNGYIPYMSSADLEFFNDCERRKKQSEAERKFKEYLNNIGRVKEQWISYCILLTIRQYHRRIIIRRVKVRNGKMVRVK